VGLRGDGINPSGELINKHTHRPVVDSLPAPVAGHNTKYFRTADITFGVRHARAPSDLLTFCL
jgi:hypothetical protein